MNALKLIGIVIGLSLLSCTEMTSKHQVSTEKVTEIKNDIQRVEPPHWWVGFKNKTLQLLVHHPEIGNATPQINYTGVSITAVHKAESPNYLFLDLELAENTLPGQFNITFQFEDQPDLVQTYTLKARSQSAEDYVGFKSSDAIYLITPDRFANASPQNDTVEGLLEQGVDRADNYARHGGDLQGITEHLDYIEDLGFTAVWPCPVLTNDMPSGSYHGYAMTDFYQVDPRFGTLADYKALAENLRGRHMKLIMDQVANHCGLQHWWMKDLPFKDWVNYQENYEKYKSDWDWKTTITSNHRRTTNQDPYASKIDYKEMTEGWFVSDMPDLNQRNPFMATYIIQNSLWWVETLGLGGIRQDTYPYPDKTFMGQWAEAIMTEYPNFSIVGEEWSYNPLLIGYWQEGHHNTDGYQSHLSSTMDFAMQKNIIEALNEDESWDQGLIKMYEGLANDFAYTAPKAIMAFLDNHDKSRVYTELNGDLEKTKMALSYLLTMPRIPQIYYGTEILMDDFDNPGDHGLIRTDFPGGWHGDQVNAFTGKGLSTAQKEMQLFLKQILNYRKTSMALQEGETLHFAPENGIYVLARSVTNETVVHIINKNESPQDLELSRFEELGLQGKTLTNIVTHDNIVWDKTLQLKAKSSVILSYKVAESL